MIQPIADIAEICHRKGITNAVISPGSRNAPLTLAFSRHKKITTYVIPDERAAGFIAIGLSCTLGEPVVLICTSGSAVYNYAPAIAEAFYSQIPLIVLSADRPPEWLDQYDGQTIRQNKIFGDHVKDSFNFPDAFEHPDKLWHSHRMVSEAINLASSVDQGPVHINIPLREPFYPKKGESIQASKEIKVIDLPSGRTASNDVDFESLSGELQQYEKILVVPGQNIKNESLISSLQVFSERHHVPVPTDNISNCGSISNAIIHHDLFLAQSTKGLEPDLLITFGQSIISKNLKLFLRKNPPKAHWHISPSGTAADTFQSLTQIIACQPEQLLNKLGSLPSDASNDYLQRWREIDDNVHKQFGPSLSGLGFWELTVVEKLIQALPKNCHLHLGNSMPVRWANFVNSRRGDISVYANRGTSGIDGCLSAAVGCALATNDPVLVILGDMSFLYDRNGLWHNYLPSNLRIAILNNQGGGIFRLIEGPSDHPEVDQFFVTNQLLTSENTVKDHDIEYLAARDHSELLVGIEQLMTMDSKTKLLEVFLDSRENKKKFSELKAILSKS